MKWSDKVKYGHFTVNRGTKAILDAANIILKSKRYGGEKSPITLHQGSYNRGGVAASGDTHGAGAAFDCSSHNIKKRERLFRILGVAFYYREALKGVWIAHGHGIVDGDGTASAAAKGQVVAYRKRRNALANNGPDTGYKMHAFPLFVAPWTANGKPGVRYLQRNANTWEQPSSKSKKLGPLKKGAKFTVVAVVRTGTKTYWGINPNGLIVPMSALGKKKPAKK